MGIIIAISRYVLPLLCVILLSRCILTLLLGHPKEKIYAYVIDMRTGERHPLNMWETSLGRSNSSDVVIPYETVSRSHAVISRRIDGWYVYDLQSKAGIKINGSKITDKATVNNGDMISLANMDFRFEIIDDPVQRAGKHRKKNKGPAADPAYPSAAQRAPVGNQHYHRPRMINVRTGDVFILVGNRVTIGAAPKCDIRLHGYGVSRTHSVLVLYEDGWAITDANSTNGTLLNGIKITEPQLLFDGDIITFGTENLCFKTKTR